MMKTSSKIEPGVSIRFTDEQYAEVLPLYNELKDRGERIAHIIGELDTLQKEARKLAKESDRKHAAMWETIYGFYPDCRDLECTIDIENRCIDVVDDESDDFVEQLRSFLGINKKASAQPHIVEEEGEAGHIVMDGDTGEIVHEEGMDGIPSSVRERVIEAAREKARQMRESGAQGFLDAKIEKGKAHG